MKKLLLILSILFTTSVYADHDKALLEGDLYMQNLPGLCGTPENVATYIKHFEFEPYHLSLGREGMRKDGQPVYMVTYYINKDGTETTVTIDVPSGSERCIVFHTFDLTKPQKN